MPASYSRNAWSFHLSPAAQASTRPSILLRSATTSFLPLGAIIAPLRHELATLFRSSYRSPAMPHLNASIATSTSSGLRLPRGKFCGWKMRPENRPVRDAPQNCRQPRRRPSAFVALAKTLYLAMLVFAPLKRLIRISRTGSGVSGSAMRLLIVLICRSGKLYA